MNLTTLEKELEVFRVNYHSVKCTVFSDSIIYKCSRGFSDQAVLLANKKIEALGLDLFAIGTNLPAKDCYEIKSIYSESI